MISPVGRRDVARGIPIDIMEFEIDVTVAGTWSVMLASEAVWRSLPDSSKPKCRMFTDGLVIGLVPPAVESIAPRLSVFPAE